TERRAMEKTVVADEVASDSLDAEVRQSRNERFERPINVIAMESRVDGRIPAPVDDQVAFEHAVVIGRVLGVEGSFDAVIGTQPIECERNGVQFGIGSGAEKLLWIVPKNSLSRIA